MGSWANDFQSHIVQHGKLITSISISEKHSTSIAIFKAPKGLNSNSTLVRKKVTSSKSRVLSKVVAVTSHIKIKPRCWHYIVVHHSGIDEGNAESYGSEHLNRGMKNGLAYHFLIGNGHGSGDGEIEIGPRWLRQLDGGHVRNAQYNKHGIGICLVGNLNRHPMTVKQKSALFLLIDWLRDEAPLGGKPKVTVHCWVDSRHTLCPGKYFPFDRLKKRYR